jgi:uncharacterized protein YndB with AHSA1/START domain
MQKEINQTWFFKQSPQEVWEYLTRPELIEQWLMKTDFQPIAGANFRFTFNAKPGSQYEGVVHCRVLEVTPFTRLSYSWNGSTQGKGRNFNSVVEWTLAPTTDGTELHLKHDGFEVLEDILNHTNGWNSCINKLQEQINSTQYDRANA